MKQAGAAGFTTLVVDAAHEPFPSTLSRAVDRGVRERLGGTNETLTRLVRR